MAQDLSNHEHLALLTAYGAKDAIVQGRILRPLLESAKKWGALKGIKADSELAPHIRDMGLLGFPQCIQQAERFNEAISLRRDRITKELQGFTGNTSFNPGSSAQVSKYLYKTRGLTPALNADGDDWEEDDPYCVNRPALLALEETGVPPDISRFINLKIQHGSLSTLLSNNIRRVYRIIRKNKDLGPRPRHPSNPRELTWLQPSFRQEASTSRLVSNPNVQNYTSRGAVNTRTLFRAPGWIVDHSHPWGFVPDTNFKWGPHVYIVTDSAQIELRLYAAESGDAYYSKAFIEGLDCHTMNVASLARPGLAMEKVMKIYYDFMAKLEGKQGKAEAMKAKKIRTLYKTVVFGMLYGGGAEKIFSIMAREVDKATGVRQFPGLTDLERGGPEKGLAQVRQIYETFHRVHPELRSWHEAVDNFVLRNGFIDETAGGRRFIYPDGTAEPNSARNFRIQSAAAWWIGRALKTLGEQIPHRGWSPYSGLVTQVHDEVTVCVPLRYAKKAYRIAEEAFKGEHKGIPLFGEPEVNIRYAGAVIPFEQLPGR